MNNPIIQEVRAAREMLAARFDYDLHRIIADAISRQAHQRTVNRQSGSNKMLLHRAGAAGASGAKLGNEEI